MNKYKLVCAIIFLVGSFQVLYSLATIFVVIPKILDLYESLGSANISIIPTLLSNILVFLIGVVNIMLAWKLLSNKTADKEKYLKIAAVMLMVSFGLILFSILISVLNTVGSVYNLNDY